MTKNRSSRNATPRGSSSRGHSAPQRGGAATPTARGLPRVLGPIFVCLILAAVGLFEACERFPEYVGPMVAITSMTEVVGPVTRVRDGDTIEVAQVPIRFGSLDCAERDTAEGRRATARMRSLISNQNLHCYLNGPSSYDRKIGSCMLQDGRDLAAVLMDEGYCGRFW